jgi:hypothetical protein
MTSTVRSLASGLLSGSQKLWLFCTPYELASSRDANFPEVMLGNYKESA